MDNLLKTLRQLTLDIENGKILVLSDFEDDVIDLIKLCKTEEDIVNLALKIKDGLIPGTHLYQDMVESYLYSNLESYGDLQIIDEIAINIGGEIQNPKETITYYHNEKCESYQYPMEESDDEKQNETDIDKLDRLLNDMNIIPEWKTWGDFFKDFGYEYPEMLNSFMINSYTDILEILENYEVETISLDSERISSDLQYLQKIFQGDMNVHEIICLTDSIIEFCENDSENDDEEFDSDDETSIDDAQNLYEVLKKDLDKVDYSTDYERFAYLKTELELVKDDLNLLNELWEEIDEFMDDLEMNEYSNDDIKEAESDIKKRKRIEFDIINQPIEEIKFEQRQTDLLLDKPAFKLLVQEIAQDVVLDLIFTDEALEALQEASEAELIKIFQEANKKAIHAERTHISSEDFPKLF